MTSMDFTPSISAPRANEWTPDPLAYPHPTYALVSMAHTQQAQAQQRRRVGIATSEGSSNIVVMSWTTSSVKQTSPPDPIDETLDLP